MRDAFDAKKQNENDFWDLSAIVEKENAREKVDIKGVMRGKNDTALPRARDVRLIPLTPAAPSSRETGYQASALGNTVPNPSNTIEYKPQTQPLIMSIKIIKTGYAGSVSDSFSVYWEKFRKRDGEECPYVPMHEESPVYTSFQGGALSYYLWWRTCLKRNEYIKCDWSYLSLRLAELINCAEYPDAEQTLSEMWRLYEVYTDEKSEFYIPQAPSRLAEAICDYSLIHGLSVPDDVSDELILRAVKNARFREIFFDSAHPECFMKLLVHHCSDHPFFAGRYTEEMAEIDCNRYIYGALAYAIRKAKAEHIEHPLGMEFKEKTTVQRTAFGGGVFVLPRNRCVIGVSFCSANRSYTLRNTVTGIVKHCENCMRSYVGITSRLKVYSLEPFFRDTVDEFFSLTLPKRQKKRSQKKEEKEAIAEYEKYYDLPASNGFSVERAKKIEERSWTLTERLVAEIPNEQAQAEETVHSPTVAEETKESELKEEIRLEETLGGILSACPQYKEFLFAIKEGKRAFWQSESKRLGKPPAVIADEINAVSFDVLGDILIEENKEDLSIIEEYLYVFDEI